MTKTPKAAKPAPTTLSPKQAQVKITTLLKGIDNSSITIRKHQDLMTESVRKVQDLIPAIAAVPAQKPVPAAKPAKVPAAKPAKPAKPAKEPTPAAKKSAVVKPAAKSVAKPAVKVATTDNRPPFKQVISEIITKNGGPLEANEIFKAAENKAATGGYDGWSRQSLYMALKDTKKFAKTEGGYGLAAVAPSRDAIVSTGDEDAEAFINSVEKNQEVSAVILRSFTLANYGPEHLRVNVRARSV